MQKIIKNKFLLNCNMTLHTQKQFCHESVVGFVIQLTGMVDFDNGFSSWGHMKVLLGGRQCFGNCIKCRIDIIPSWVQVGLGDSTVVILTPVRPSCNLLGFAYCKSSNIRHTRKIVAPNFSQLQEHTNQTNFRF